MAAFLDASSTMVMMLVVFVFGYVLRKANITNDNFDSVFSKVLWSTACPAIIIDSVLANSNIPDSGTVWQIFGVSIISFIPPIVLGLVIARLFRVPSNERGAYAFTIAFSNTGMVGFAVVDALLGTDAVLYLSIYNIPYNVVLFSVGAWMISRTGTVKLSRKEQLSYVRKNFCTPIMAACFAALVLALLRITDDGIIEATCSFLGSMNAPGSMIIIGSTLAKYDLCSMLTNVWAYLTAFARLLVVPLAVYFVCGFFLADAEVLATITLVSGVPAAMAGTVMSLIYGGDLRVLSQGMFLTTVFSLVTIPIIMMVVL